MQYIRKKNKHIKLETLSQIVKIFDKAHFLQNYIEIRKSF